MRGKVVVSSFHSSSIKYIEDHNPDVIISLDSHADTILLGFTGKLMAVAENMPKKLGDAFLRPSTHMLMRSRMPDLEIFVVTPLKCLTSATLGEYKRTHKILDSQSVIDESAEMTPQRAIEFQKLFIEKLLKMKSYTSPPNSLKKLADNVRGRKVVIDIDMDYLADGQGECYTMAPGLEIKDGRVTTLGKSDLGSAEKVLKLIKQTKPGLITLSEAKLAALHTPNSFTEKFLKRLQGLRYKVEYGALLTSDEEAFNLMEKCDDFVNGKLVEIQRKHINHSLNEEQMAEEETEIAKAMMEYFLGKNARGARA